MLQNRITFSVISRRVASFALAGALATLLGLSSTGCNTGPKGPMNVPLSFRPAHAEPIAGTITATDVKVHLAQVNDKRQNKEQIGQNMENASNPIPIYAAADKSPGEFLRGVVMDELKKFGVDIVDAPEAADRVIQLDLNKFWVEETGTYKAEVSATATVKDKGGTSRWKGSLDGQGTTFGRSLSAENYNEALSDATRRAVGSMLTNPKFQESLSR
jgi:hypothetical protein